MELYLNDKLGKISYEINDTPVAGAVLILAHGAGAGMDHPFMEQLAQKICENGVSVVRFNFPYKEKGRKAPGSPNDAILAWSCMIKETQKLFHGKKLFVSGKSYGGRMASHLLSANHELGVDGIIYFGFPLHAPGKEDMKRAEHLRDITIPQLFIQGTKDKLANIALMRQVVSTLPLSTMKEIESGDHSFKTPKSVASPETIMDTLAIVSVDWMLES